MEWARIVRFFKGGPIETPKTDLSSKVDQMIFHKFEALRLAGELERESAKTRADLETATSKLVAAATPAAPALILV